MSKYIIRHGSIMQDAQESGITPPDIVEQLTVKRGSATEDAGGGSLDTRVSRLETTFKVDDPSARPNFLVQISDLSNMIPGMITCNYTAKELHYYLGNGARVQRLVIGNATVGIYYNIGEEIEEEKDATGNFVKRIRRVKFPAGLSDIVVDVVNNTITLDTSA